MQVLAVASATLSALTSLTLASIAASRSQHTSASLGALALSTLASLACAPLRRAEADRVARWFAMGTFFALAGCRVLGLAVAAANRSVADVTTQLFFGALMHAGILVVSAAVPRALAVCLVSVVGFAVFAGLTRGALPPAAHLALAWSALTVARWLQVERYLTEVMPVTEDGRLAPWRHPGPRWLVWPLDLLANSRTMQLLLEPLPVVEMRSDITEVVYVNYLVEAALLERFVPEGLALQRLGPGGRYALFTFLTYHHGHFGFSLLGPLRRLFPSPFQTNWRVHVTDPRSGHRGIRFVTNAIDWTAPALGARLLSEGMPMHVLHRASLTRDGDAMHLTLDPGTGSAPDVDATLRPASPRDGVYRDGDWSGPWAECFADRRAFLEYCLPQDRAMDAQPWRGRVSRQEIHLGIPAERCIPLTGSVRSEAARRIVGDAEPLCFLVPDVAFRFRVEDYDPLPAR
jgi:hypothetical protein